MDNAVDSELAGEVKLLWWKHVPVPLYPPQIPHELTWYSTIYTHNSTDCIAQLSVFWLFRTDWLPDYESRNSCREEVSEQVPSQSVNQYLNWTLRLSVCLHPFNFKMIVFCPLTLAAHGTGVYMQSFFCKCTSSIIQWNCNPLSYDISCLPYVKQRKSPSNYKSY
jgi:hypothetical protein